MTVFDPSPVLTITVENSPTGADEIHVHAGGQGVWVARMIAGLGGRPILCCTLGGETGRVIAELATAESIEVRQVSGPEPTGAYVHDRRQGERQVVAESFPPPLDRHRVDDLFGMTLTTALETGACVLAGPMPEGVVPPGVYRRLCRSLTEQGIAVVADLSRGALAAALEAEPTTVRVNVEQLREIGLVADTSDRAVLAAMEQLQRRGVSSIVVSRGSEPLLALVDGVATRVRFPRLEPQDPHGTGDSITAAIALAHAERRPLLEALPLGAAAGSLNVTRRGLGTGDRASIQRLADAVVVERVDRRPGAPPADEPELGGS